jgi:hypothetical protein
MAALSAVRASTPGFSRLLTVEESLPSDGSLALERSRHDCAELESGHIIFFPRSPNLIPPEDTG